MSLGLLKWAARMLTEEAIRKWVSHNRHALCERTHIHYSMVIWRFNHFAPVNLKDLTVEHIEAYLQSILKRYTKRTANAHLTAIKSFCRWAAEHHNLPNPAAKIKMLKENPPRQRILTPEEYKKVLSICSELEADVIKFLGNTALRASEFQSLKANNISPCGQFIAFAGKGNRRRVVPLNRICRKILTKNIKPNSNTIHLTKSYSNRNALYRLCSQLAKRAGVPRFGPHAIRHYCVTEMLRYIPLHLVSKIVGHADTRTTEKIYWHLNAEKDLLGVTEILNHYL